MNALFAICPYFDQQTRTWMFDDESRGITREPFVQGIPTMIDDITKDVPNARNGFRLLFSLQQFPGCQRQLKKTRPEFGGVWYTLADRPEMEGWLCPVLFQFFDAAPDEIYVKAEALD